MTAVLPGHSRCPLCPVAFLPAVPVCLPGGMFRCARGSLGGGPARLQLHAAFVRGAEAEKGRPRGCFRLRR